MVKKQGMLKEYHTINIFSFSVWVFAFIQKNERKTNAEYRVGLGKGLEIVVEGWWERWVIEVRLQSCVMNHN